MWKEVDDVKWDITFESEDGTVIKRYAVLRERFLAVIEELDAEGWFTSE